MVKFFLCSLCSLCIHCALLWLLWQEGIVAYGVARNINASAPTSSTITARIVSSEKVAVPTFRQEAEGKRLRATPESLLETLKIGNPAELGLETVTAQDYAAAGRLTRLPVPVSDIDLDVAGINDIDVIGKIELTVLVNRIGIVVDVIPVVEVEGARVFAQRVAQLFRNARFIPGEINAKAVNSQLRVTVMSEKLGNPPAK